jgi:hypothetical protein
MHRACFLLLSLGLVMGCAKLPEPVAPDAPSVPEPPPAPESLTAPQKPIVTQALGVAIDASPTRFPVRRSDLMVVAIPADVGSQPEKGSPALSAGDIHLREAFIYSFLRSGYRVKDAGLVSLGQLSMRRHPATETERSRTVTEAETNAKGAISEKTTEVTASRDYDWWSNHGLTLNLKDPTSLWAPELLRYQALAARYFFRVFEIKITKGIPERAEGFVDKRDYETYLAAVEAYNEQVRQQKNAFAEYDSRHDTYLRGRKQYEAVYVDYEAAHRKYLEEVRRYNEQTLPPLEAPPLIPMKEGVHRVSAANEITPLSKEQLELAGPTAGAKEVNTVNISAEVIQTETGEVVWAGNIWSTGDLYWRVLVARAIEQLAGSGGN